MNLPAFACVSGCSACCKASLAPFSHAEKERMEAAAPGHRWMPWGDDAWVLTEQFETMRCPLLGPDDRCSAYDARPMVCRLYGLVDAPGMTCKRGGKAARMLTDKEARRLMARARTATPKPIARRPNT